MIDEHSAEAGGVTLVMMTAKWAWDKVMEWRKREREEDAAKAKDQEAARKEDRQRDDDNQRDHRLTRAETRLDGQDAALKRIEDGQAGLLHEFKDLRRELQLDMAALRGDR